ncbi:potassium-transporting ATPase subunit KdpC [Paenibacillus turpanensis]|uniref:potassium-transporting ATPase subunit KdpC n=1 Tax=Paenibacillus turpanensis TaxID=2689078 RepID=UPI001409EEFF|nr:potassium-transporting ATPase subunit KdpC [Paenibacillus turpanensis]
MFSIIVRTSFVFMLVCGLLYHLAVTAIAQIVMPYQANGSLVKDEQGTVIGSELVGQSFTDPKWFHGRLSSIEYAADGSGSPNYAPSHPDMLARTLESVEQWEIHNPQVARDQLPIDLVTNSASGLDPHISIQGAKAQIPRVSAQTGIPLEELERMVEEHIKGRELGFLGEPVVNVLLLNIDVSHHLK